MSDTLADALGSPGISALIGAAQGFGNAALPSRMPVPFGAALAQGLGGSLQGLKTSQAFQEGQQQIQAAQMQNQMTKMYLGALPGVVGGGGLSGGASAGSAPGTVGSGGAAPAGTNFNGAYLVPPSRSVMLGDLSLLRGDPSAASKFYEQAQNLAGGPGYAMGPGGSAFPVPGGKADPATAAMLAAATAGGTKAGEAPYAPPISVKRPLLDANGNVVGTQEVQVPVPQWAANNRNGTPSPLMAPTGSARTTTTPQGAATGALSSLPDDPTRQMAVNAALKSGLPVDAWAPWMATVYGESGFNLSAPDNKNDNGTYDVGPGQVNSANFARLGLTDKSARDPATNLAASAQIFNENWQASHDPARAMAGYNTGDINGKPPNYSQSSMNRLAGWGYPGSAPSIATSSLGRVPPVGPPPTGMGGNVELGPAAASNLAVQQAWLKPNDLRAGGVTPVPPGVNPAMPQGGALQAPRTEELVAPGGQKGPAHIILPNPYTEPGAPATAVPVVVGGVQPSAAGALAGQPQAGATPGTVPKPGSIAVSALAPDTVQAREELSKGLYGKDTDSFIAANNTQGWLDQIDHAANVMNTAGSVYQTGPYAPQRYALMNGINDAARTLGLPQMFDANALSSAEEMRKATTTAGFEFASHYEGHARQAAQTIMSAITAVPGMQNSPLGVRLVSHGINEGAQDAIDMHNYNIARSHGADPYGIAPDEARGVKGGAGMETAEADFVNKFPAPMYANRAISTVQPFPVKTDMDLQKYLPGTFVLYKGNTVQVPARPDAPPIPYYLIQPAR